MTSCPSPSSSVVLNAVELPRKRRRIEEVTAVSDNIADIVQKCREYARCQSLSLMNTMSESMTSCAAAAYRAHFSNGFLQRHQMAGVTWMRAMYMLRINGILADEMGLGKTVQAIALICAVMAGGDLGPFLIVCPLAVLRNWEEELSRFAPSVTKVVIHGVKQEKAMSKSRFSRSWNRDERAGGINVVLTTYEVMIKDASFFKRRQWQVLVLDEGHRIKNPKSKLLGVLKKLTIRTRFLLTGTPLQNCIEELWTLLQFVMPQLFNSVSVDELKRDITIASNTLDDEEDDEVAENAASASSHPSSRMPWLPNEEITSILHRIISPFILRRVKTEILDYKMPAKIVKKILLQMTDEQVRLQKHFLSREAMKRFNGTQIFAIIRKISTHPLLVRDLFPRGNQMQLDSEQYLMESSIKFQALNALVPTMMNEGHRILLFAQLIQTLDLVQRFLEECLRVQVCRVDGRMNCARRQQAFERFACRDVDIMILSTRAAGLGLNLAGRIDSALEGRGEKIVIAVTAYPSITGADTVIILENDWNPMTDEQAQDRCHRIGQSKDVLVLKFQCFPSPYDQLQSKLTAQKKAVERQVMQPMISADHDQQPIDSSSHVQTISQTDYDEHVKVQQQHQQEEEQNSTITLQLDPREMDSVVTVIDRWQR